MWPNPQETVDLVTFTEEILNEKLHFLCSVRIYKQINFPFSDCFKKHLQIYFRKQPFRGILLKRYSENAQQIYKRTPMPKCNFNKVALQLYWNHTSAWMFSCKFSAYFQNTFSQEHHWMPASVFHSWTVQ